MFFLSFFSSFLSHTLLALKIAELADIVVPPYTKVLIAEGGGSPIQDDDIFAHEKLSPTMGIYRAKDFEEAVEMACKVVGSSWRHRSYILFVHRPR